MNKFSPLLTAGLKTRFRGFLPVIVDVETAGIDPRKNALLEVGLVLIDIDAQGFFVRKQTFFENILPFDGAELDAKSLAFNHIDPFQPLRYAIDEKQALIKLFKPIQEAIKAASCQRAVLVGHNAWFDLLFIKEAVNRHQIASPFHAFTCFDTATLGGLLYGQTVLAKVAKAAGIEFDANQAHNALYDAEKTAEVFCTMLNTWRDLMTGTH